MAEIEGIAIGELGMTQEEFRMMLPGIYYLKLFYFNKAKLDKMKFYANLLRQQTFDLININLPSEKKIPRPEDLWKFEWDNNREKENFDKAELEQSRIEMMKLASEFL